jgi:hypothetical protein
MLIVSSLYHYAVLGRLVVIKLAASIMNTHVDSDLATKACGEISGQAHSRIGSEYLHGRRGMITDEAADLSQEAMAGFVYALLALAARP